MDGPLSPQPSALSPQPSHNFPFTREIAKPLRPTERRAPFVRVLLRAPSHSASLHPFVNYRATRHPAPPAPAAWPCARRRDPEFCATRRCKLILKEPHHARGLSP